MVFSQHQFDKGVPGQAIFQQAEKKSALVFHLLWPCLRLSHQHAPFACFPGIGSWLLLYSYFSNSANCFLVYHELMAA
jgi:hypothetical protein